jgi:hypothetical protein
MVGLVRSWVSCVVGFVLLLLLAIAEPAAVATCVWHGTARKVSGKPRQSMESGRQLVVRWRRARLHSGTRRGIRGLVHPRELGIGIAA